MHFQRAAWLSFLLVLSPLAQEHAEDDYAPFVHDASEEAGQAVLGFSIAEGIEIELWAAEPLLANPVSFWLDERGRMYVAETFRLHHGVTDMRQHMDWLDEDLATRTVEERLEMMRAHEGEAGYERYAVEHERLRLLSDTDGDGVADTSQVFADGFNEHADGIAAGLLSRGGDLYYGCIPNLWLLRDDDRDGVADSREVLQTGYGVNISLLGHDLHGIQLGVDGRLYFSIGDRGFHVEHEGKTYAHAHTGAVLRCELDGSNLEIFATGLRNPQELTFDDYGNLWTGDNNSDGGDRARWVYVVEGGDSGWRYAYQWINRPNLRGPWNAEKLWHPPHAGQAAYVVPPIANLASGPSGLAYYPGTGLDERYRGHFFLCDFRGRPNGSGVHAFDVTPKGAGFELGEVEQFLWNALVTDFDFGPDSAMYATDWVNGWGQPNKGRAWRLTDPLLRADEAANARILEVARLLAEGFEERPLEELGALLAHPDRRVRLEAQLALAAHGEEANATLLSWARQTESQLARLHALWGLGQLARASFLAPLHLLPFLSDEDPEVRAQTARCLSDVKSYDSSEALLPLLDDASARVRFFAAIGVGHGGRADSVPRLLDALAENADADPWLRHAYVHALELIGRQHSLDAGFQHPHASARLGTVVALRRLSDERVADFLEDEDPLVVMEAARAIYDTPLEGALPRLARLALDAPTDNANLWRRILNACFRLGGEGWAIHVARAATNRSLPEPVRIEALGMLSDWDAPSVRDRVNHEIRPIERERPLSPALVRHVFRTLTSADNFASEPSDVQRSAVALFAEQGLEAAQPFLRDLSADTEVADSVRVRALDGLAEMGSDLLPAAVRAALDDEDARVSRKGYELLSNLPGAQALPLLTDVLASGSAPQKQGALDALAQIDASEVDALLATALAQLANDDFEPAAALELVHAAEARGDALADELAAWRASLPADDPLGEARILVSGGDAELGRRLFREDQRVSCLRCHSFEGEGGGEAGPELTGVGTRRTSAELLHSVLDPSATIVEGFQFTTFWLEDGDSLVGSVVEEAEGWLTIETPQRERHEVHTDDIETREDAPSSMPANVGEQLSRAELRDVVAFLASLRDE